MGGYSKFQVLMFKTKEGRASAKFVSGHRDKVAATRAAAETARNVSDEWEIVVEPVEPGK